jgi:molybdate transport system regulatory protein
MSVKVRTNLRFTLPGGAPLSHGKATLMEWIRDTGSIRQAAQKMDMSYRRGWLLVDELNRMFDEASVETKHGGKSGGGAQLTAFGSELLARFRTMEARMAEALKSDLDWMQAHARAEDATPSAEAGD